MKKKKFNWFTFLVIIVIVAILVCVGVTLYFTISDMSEGERNAIFGAYSVLGLTTLSIISTFSLRGTLSADNHFLKNVERDKDKAFFSSYKYTLDDKNIVPKVVFSLCSLIIVVILLLTFTGAFVRKEIFAIASALIVSIFAIIGYYFNTIEKYYENKRLYYIHKKTIDNKCETKTIKIKIS